MQFRKHCIPYIKTGLFKITIGTKTKNPFIIFGGFDNGFVHMSRKWFPLAITHK